MFTVYILVCSLIARAQEASLRKRIAMQRVKEQDGSSCFGYLEGSLSKVPRLFAALPSRLSRVCFTPAVINIYLVSPMLWERHGVSKTRARERERERERKTELSRLYIAFGTLSRPRLTLVALILQSVPGAGRYCILFLEGRPDDFIGCDTDALSTLQDPRSFALTPSLSLGRKGASNGCNIRLYWLLELGRPSCVSSLVSFPLVLYYSLDLHADEFSRLWTRGRSRVHIKRPESKRFGMIPH